MTRALPESLDNLDPVTCRHARLSRDKRFDGEFYVAVSSTGIYCRPVCPARTPAEKNVTYFRHASQAAHAGYRPCLRCRPESAPASPAWQGTSTTVQRALRLIAEGALNNQGLPQLAARLGVGERYLRKLFANEVGVSPNTIAQHQRLLFARKLIFESTLPLTDVALAAGFGSVRRFNSAMREHFRQTPTELRRQAGDDQHTDGITLLLQYRPPYDWAGVVDLFARHSVEPIESADETRISRQVFIDDRPVGVAISHAPDRDALRLEIEGAEPTTLMHVAARVRTMFDLDANPAAISGVLGRDRYLAPLVANYPGVRSPCYGSLYEASVRAIVGQQVSIQAARNVLARLTAAAIPPGETPHFPQASQLLKLGDDAFPMPGRRRDTLRALCTGYNAQGDAFDLDALSALKGVGPWTVAMVAMRGTGRSDLFPTRDLGLEKAWLDLTDENGADLYEHARQWRPWGAYAANLLWRSLTP